MDHSHSHGGGGGGGGGGTGLFSPLNRDLARRYWYTIAGFVGALVAIRAVNVYKSQRR
jgi:hypothetical protein